MRDLRDPNTSDYLETEDDWHNEYGAPSAGPVPGKRALTDRLTAHVRQFRGATSVTPGTATTASGGSGSPLPDDVRGRMERSFGADFSAVRVHESGEAATHGAEAMTQGSDIHFAPGRWDPSSPAGLDLLGHELTHVVQQAQGRVAATTQAKGVAANVDHRLEREADDLGARAARGERVTSAGIAAPTSGPAQFRMSEEERRIAEMLRGAIDAILAAHAQRDVDRGSPGHPASYESGPLAGAAEDRALLWDLYKAVHWEASYGHTASYWADTAWRRIAARGAHLEELQPGALGMIRGRLDALVPADPGSARTTEVASRRFPWLIHLYAHISGAGDETFRRWLDAADIRTIARAIESRSTSAPRDDGARVVDPIRGREEGTSDHAGSIYRGPGPEAAPEGSTASRLDWDAADGGSARGVTSRRVDGSHGDGTLREEFALNRAELVERLFGTGITLEQAEGAQRVAQALGRADLAAEVGRRLFRVNEYAVVETLDVEGSERYQANPRNTFCITYAADVTSALGAYIPTVWWTPSALRRLRDPERTEPVVPVLRGDDRTVYEINANALNDWLQAWGHAFGWRREGDATAAQQAANDGHVVIAAAHGRGERAGHVAVVLAESSGSEYDPEGRLHAHRGEDGRVDSALESNAGEHNFRYDSRRDRRERLPEESSHRYDYAWTNRTEFSYWVWEGATSSPLATPEEMGYTGGAGGAGGSASEPEREPTQLKRDESASSSARPPADGRPGAGGALPDDVRGRMERSFGADFSAVRVHESGEAASHGAHALTRGSEIHFAPGRWDPSSPAGLDLLGHELTHVVQQAEGRVPATTQSQGSAVNVDHGLEREADDLGARAARGERVASADVVAPTAGPAQFRLTEAERRIAETLARGIREIIAHAGPDQLDPTSPGHPQHWATGPLAAAPDDRALLWDVYKALHFDESFGHTARTWADLALRRIDARGAHLEEVDPGILGVAHGRIDSLVPDPSAPPDMEFSADDPYSFPGRRSGIGYVYGGGAVEGRARETLTQYAASLREQGFEDYAIGTETFRNTMGREGYTSAINTWDGMILSWGTGFAHGGMLGALWRALDPQVKGALTSMVPERFTAAGIVVDQAIRTDLRALGALVSVTESDAYFDLVLHAQLRTFLVETMGLSADRPLPGFHLPTRNGEFIYLSARLVHARPALWGFRGDLEEALQRSRPAPDVEPEPTDFLAACMRIHAENLLYYEGRRSGSAVHGGTDGEDGRRMQAAFFDEVGRWRTRIEHFSRNNPIVLSTRSRALCPAFSLASDPYLPGVTNVADTPVGHLIMVDQPIERAQARRRRRHLDPLPVTYHDFGPGTAGSVVPHPDDEAPGEEAPAEEAAPEAE